MASNCRKCGQFRGRGHVCPSVSVPTAGGKRGRSTLADAGADTAAPSYDTMYSRYSGSESRHDPTQPEDGVVYYVYDEYNNVVNMYQTEADATRASYRPGWQMRKFVKEEQGLIKRVFGDGYGYVPEDGGPRILPIKPVWTPPARMYDARDRQGRIVGRYEEEGRARYEADKVGGTVQEMVLKGPVPWWKRPFDDGSNYEPAN